MDGEIRKLQALFGAVDDKRGSNSSHKLEDILMSGYAMFSLKHPSLHSFKEQKKLKKLILKRFMVYRNYAQIPK